MPRDTVRITRTRSRFRIQTTPILSVMLGSLIVAVPVIAQSPILPPLGLLMLLGWRLLRPEIWPVWIGAPLGFFDDMWSGNPMGSSVFLWTACLLLIETANSRLLWRSYWEDWLLAAACIGLCLLGAAGFIRLSGSGGNILIVLPQLFWSILLFPLVVRLCKRIDRWRLPQ